MHPEYFQTRFVANKPIEDWPKEFAILSAYSTTGVVWSATQNENADQKLQAELASANVWMRRITGFSPTTGHRELSWVIEIPFDVACDYGFRFKQDAIYYVIQDILWVSYCDQRRQMAPVGNFRERVVLRREIGKSRE